MSSREWRERIQDILDAITEIQAFTQGMDKDAFCQDARTVRAVELDFIIIGEAANQISNDILERYNDVPWHLVRAMRNRLVHVYFSVDPVLLWDTIQNDLPGLKAALERLLREA